MLHGNHKCILSNFQQRLTQLNLYQYNCFPLIIFHALYLKYLQSIGQTVMLFAIGKDCGQSLLTSFLDLVIPFHSYSEAKERGMRKVFAHSFIIVEYVCYLSQKFSLFNPLSYYIFCKWNHLLCSSPVIRTSEGYLPSEVK